METELSKSQNKEIDLEQKSIAEIKNNIQGDHETQESDGGEADLHKDLVDCEKNPGHRQFIPVNTFTLDHLPEEHRDTDLYNLILVCADLTVKINVEKTSPDRPKFLPNTNNKYPSYEKNWTGSGRIWNVNKFQDGISYITKPCNFLDLTVGYNKFKYTKCWCKKCKEPGSTPSNVWWEFELTTATHVVFDDFEASLATLTLFYNTETSEVVSVKDVSMGKKNVEQDWCWLDCVTCDKNLGNKLKDIYDKYIDLWQKVDEKYYESRDEHKLMFIVSHPHGCPKQVSVGQWKDLVEVDKGIFKFNYTISTCRGTSGASVQCVGYNECQFRSDLVHSGSASGLNFTATGSII